MTNDEYSQLAAKAAGVAIGSNGKPAFTSYEQSMKYAEALTNLHKSGIDRNSTPQEIAAASVGTTVNKNGTPNISSISQGVGYGNALKNLKSNPQPNVNQNSNGTKPNNTSSKNNTTNNTKTTNNKSINLVTNVETKPLKANATENNNVIQGASSNTPSKFDEDKVANAVAILASKNTKIKIDSKGNPISSNQADKKKFWDEYNKLKKNEAQIVAAAAAGISTCANGEPRISGAYEAKAYMNAYNEYKKYKNNSTKQATNGIQLKYNESYEMDIDTNAGDKKLTTTGGVGAYNGRKETYYSQRKLPGRGLQIPGRHVSSEDGTVRDKDGYIVVAADLSIYPKGTILECSLGPCKVYDTGVTGEHLDIYCDWMDGIEYSDMTQEQRNSTVTTLKRWNAGER